jgi:hypothetical protein
MVFVLSFESFFPFAYFLILLPESVYVEYLGSDPAGASSALAKLV